MDCKIGRVQSIHTHSIEILVERHSACSGCHAKGMCSSADRKDETFTIKDFPEGLKVGDRVKITASGNAKPIKAVLYVFVIPLILLLIEAIALSVMNVSENTLLLVLVSTIVVYALILRLFRGYFEKTFKLKVEGLA